MKPTQLNALKLRPFCLDAYYLDKNQSAAEIIFQATPYISIEHRRIYLSYYVGEWVCGWIQLQDQKIERLKMLSDWNQLDADRMSSEIFDYQCLVKKNADYIKEGLVPPYDTARGLRAVYLNPSELDQLLNSTAPVTNPQKLYILVRHINENQRCETLSDWTFSDADEPVWAMIKAMRENHLFG
jgi:hypothetical protein